MKQHNADIKILCLHWGNEYVHIPSQEQRELAYQFIDAGADIIAGHHPHVIQPYEKYKNGHIFYSLGNFMFDFLQSKKISVGLHAVINVSHKKVNTIEFHGIDLSYKDLVKNANQNSFNFYFNRINKRYSELLLLDGQEYSNFYSSNLKRKHLLERINMKLSLLTEFFRIETRAKINLIKNIYSHYFKR
jgi:gamma-polyglutamate biosynthesis protein CapA